MFFHLLVAALLSGFMAIKPVSAVVLIENQVFTNGQATNITRDAFGESIMLYDQETGQIIFFQNLNNPADLRIAVMNMDYKVKKVFRGPISPSLKRAYSIETLSFYPTAINNLLQKKAGLIVLRTNRGFININLQTLKAKFTEFRESFLQVGRFEDIPFQELTSPSFIK